MTTTTTTRAKKTAKAPVADFAGITGAALKPLATKIKKLKHGATIDTAVRALDPQPRDIAAVVAHLVRIGLLDPIQNGNLLMHVAEATLDAEIAVVIAELLARRDEAGEANVPAIRGSSLSYMPGWPDEIDQVVYRAYVHAPHAFAERASRYRLETLRGIAFVQRRSGGEIEPAIANDIVTELAIAQATYYGLTTWGRCDFIGDDGEQVRHKLETLADLRTLVLRFGSEAAWDAALLAATARNEWGMTSCVRSALVQMPIGEMTRLLAARFTPFGDSSDAGADIAAILDERNDDPAALLASLDGVVFEYEHVGRDVRAMYEAAVARRA